MFGSTFINMMVIRCDGKDEEELLRMEVLHNVEAKIVFFLRNAYVANSQKMTKPELVTQHALIKGRAAEPEEELMEKTVRGLLDQAVRTQGEELEDPPVKAKVTWVEINKDNMDWLIQFKATILLDWTWQQEDHPIVFSLEMEEMTILPPKKCKLCRSHGHHHSKCP